MNPINLQALRGQFAANSYDANSQVEDLPFVAPPKSKEEETNFWQVKGNGSYTDEFVIGSAYAVDALQFVAATGFAPLIPWVIMAMPRKNERDGGGIEIGFLTTIAVLAGYAAGSGMEVGQ